MADAGNTCLKQYWIDIKYNGSIDASVVNTECVPMLSATVEIYTKSYLLDFCCGRIKIIYVIARSEPQHTKSAKI